MVLLERCITPVVSYSQKSISIAFSLAIIDSEEVYERIHRTFIVLLLMRKHKIDRDPEVGREVESVAYLFKLYLKIEHRKLPI